MSSKIKVDTIENVAGSGNVSLGSGHNLVVPGDLTVDTSTLKVDATNNRVGIGVTSPSRKLELNNGGTGAFVTFTDGVATNFTFKTDGSNVGTFGTEAGSTHLAFMASGTERIRVHSAGSTTMSSQPAFHIQGTCVNHSAGSETAVVYASTPTIKFNIGNHGVGGTDASTSGKFTCPVAGMYYFECRWYRGNTGSPSRYMGTTVKKNGTTFVPYWYVNAAGTSSFGDQSVSASGFIQCAANDVLQQYCYSYSGDADPGTTMQIYLLG